MGIVEILLLALIAFVVGAVGQAIAGYSRGGCLASIGIGLVGAFLGMIAARSLGLPELINLQIGGVDMPIIWSILGATLFVLLLGLATRTRTRPPRRRWEAWR